MSPSQTIVYVLSFIVVGISDRRLFARQHHKRSFPCYVHVELGRPVGQLEEIC